MKNQWGLQVVKRKGVRPQHLTFDSAYFFILIHRNKSLDNTDAVLIYNKRTGLNNLLLSIQE